jgi:hypothetical protein
MGAMLHRVHGFLTVAVAGGGVAVGEGGCGGGDVGEGGCGGGEEGGCGGGVLNPALFLPGGIIYTRCSYFSSVPP